MGVFQKFSEYLLYLCQCRSEHYVHSPYVYRFMVECVKPRGRFKIQREDELFERVKNYLGDAEIMRISAKEKIPKTLSSCALFIDRPYANTERAEAWRGIIADKDVKLTIDVYYAGLVLPSKSEEKEHFCLKIF